VKGTRTDEHRVHRPTAGLLHVLVISQHEIVRRQLVAYLSRSASFDVSGDGFSVGAIARSHPDVLVLDVSRLTTTQLRQALDVTQQLGTRVVALASIYEAAVEHAVTQAGGLYRLKSAGADGLANIVHATATATAVQASSQSV